MICPHCGEDTDDYIEPPTPLTPEAWARLKQQADEGDVAAAWLIHCGDAVPQIHRSPVGCIHPIRR